MGKTKDKKTLMVISVLFIIIVLEAIYLFSSGKSASLSGSSKTSEDFAQTIIQKCKTATFRPSCYEREIPKLMDVLSMEKAFRVINYIQEKDTSLLFCHSLGHYLSDREVKKDPSQWESVMSRCTVTNQCSGGCVHGVIISRFNSEYLSSNEIEEIQKDIFEICERREGWNPTESELALCYHGLGHLFMNITKADISKSIGLCREKFSGEKIEYLPSCFQAVFMTIFEPVDPEGEALVRDIVPKKEDAEDFCSPYKGLVWESCRIETWRLFEKEILTPKGASEFCSFADKNYITQKRCYAAILNKVTIDILLVDYDLGKYKNYCLGLAKNWREFCFSEGTANFIESDSRNLPFAIRLCEIADKENFGEMCKNQIVHIYPENFLGKGSQEFKAYCKKLPGNMKENCL